MSEQIRTEPQQVGWLALVLFAPLALAAFMVTDGTRQGATAVTLIALLAAGLCAVLALMLHRRQVAIADGQLVIRHSVYTFRQALNEVTGMEVTRLPSMQYSALLSRTNGIAAFGYYSGWFLMNRGVSAYCAVSAGPVFRIGIRSGTRQRVVFLSCSDQMAAAIGRSVP